MGRSLLAGFVFFAIFVAGIITGIFLTLRWTRHQAQVQKNNVQQAVAMPLGPMVMRQMLNQLDLTRDQRKAANKILLESADTLRVMRREADFALDRIQEDLDKILTPDQRVKFDQLKDEQRAKLQAQREKIRHFIESNRDGETAPALPQSVPPSSPQPAAPPLTPAPVPAH
ncbi:MAG TPA: hypothetical protein VK785_07915 [Opitutaceae bacterium]|nr:hypothetical protein [Opitutaceae bacterium]